MYIVLAALVHLAAMAGGGTVEEFIQGSRAPGDFVLQQLASHRVVLLGESHWVADEVEVVSEIVPRLPDAGARTLAVEVFPARMQDLLDTLVNGEAWDQGGAIAVLRAVEMPHGEYLDIIHAVWSVNRKKGAGTLELVGMGPGPDWRESLPPGEDYESFMADRIRRALKRRGGSLLAFMGLHHAFARYLQPESNEDLKARRFMVRTGNRLWWEMGEELFVIGTQRPFQCRKDDAWGYCVPFGGAIDCASVRAGRSAFGFEVAGSPLAELRFDPRVIYAAGYPDLRLVDFVDGWIWFGPIDELRQTRIIPLEDYAPDRDSLAAVCGANPFDGRELSEEEVRSLWLEQTEARTNPILESRWNGLTSWRDLCEPAAADAASP